MQLNLSPAPAAHARNWRVYRPSCPGFATQIKRRQQRTLPASLACSVSEQPATVSQPVIAQPWPCVAASPSRRRGPPLLPACTRCSPWSSGRTCLPRRGPATAWWWPRYSRWVGGAWRQRLVGGRRAGSRHATSILSCHRASVVHRTFNTLATQYHQRRVSRALARRTPAALSGAAQSTHLPPTTTTTTTPTLSTVFFFFYAPPPPPLCRPRTTPAPRCGSITSACRWIQPSGGPCLLRSRLTKWRWVLSAGWWVLGAERWVPGTIWQPTAAEGHQPMHACWQLVCLPTVACVTCLPARAVWASSHAQPWLPALICLPACLLICLPARRMTCWRPAGCGRGSPRSLPTSATLAGSKWM